jgi:hypothetical protein
MQGDVELIVFLREFGCVATPKTLLRIRLTLRDCFRRLGANAT